MSAKKVFVSGCYDMLHSGHVAFFEEAALLGDLYVGIGSDRTIQELKARKTINTDAERLYMVRALKVVKEAWINAGGGLLDFEQELRQLRPDIFFVNSDGYSPTKEKLCRELGIELVISQRVPHPGLPIRSTTALRQECNIPYRIDLCGGWLDQLDVNKLHPGHVLTLSIEPDYEFSDRSGMSTSSRKKAIELWQTDIPAGNREKLARTLFCFENPPGTRYVSGSQDAIGIVMPGLSRLYYNNDFWPQTIESEHSNDLLDWIEQHLYLIPIYPRGAEYDVLSDTDITPANAKQLAEAALSCWDAIQGKDLAAFGKALVNGFEAQIRMYPHMVNEEILELLEGYKPFVEGWKLSGAGGGGYFVFVCSTPLHNALRIRIRRNL